MTAANDRARSDERWYERRALLVGARCPVCQRPMPVERKEGSRPHVLPQPVPGPGQPREAGLGRPERQRQLAHEPLLRRHQGDGRHRAAEVGLPVGRRPGLAREPSNSEGPPKSLVHRGRPTPLHRRPRQHSGYFPEHGQANVPGQLRVPRCPLHQPEFLVREDDRHPVLSLHRKWCSTVIPVLTRSLTPGFTG